MKIKNKLKKYKIIRGINNYFIFRKYANASETWPTKNYEIWIFLQIMLYKIKPESSIEFGSGRSTNYFAEYAQKNNKVFFSIEQNNKYVKMGKKGLNNTMLASDCIYKVPINGDWFDIKKLNKVVNDEVIECIFVDAPGGAFNTGSRNSNVGNKYLSSLCKDCKLIIIDDIHRQEVLDSSNNIVDSSKYNSVFLTYNSVGAPLPNVIAFHYLQKYENMVNETLLFLELEKIICNNIERAVFQ
jgi:predicted O-methyltransferase YrrM